MTVTTTEELSAEAEYRIPAEGEPPQDFSLWRPVKEGN